KLRGNRHSASQPSHQGADMGKPDALSRFVLGSRAAVQVEDALVVLRIDTAAVVGYLKDCKTELGTSAHRDLTGNAGLEVFEGVVDQIGENLLQRQTVADDVWQRVDPDLGLGFGGLMRHRRYSALEQLPGVDPHRLE